MSTSVSALTATATRRGGSFTAEEDECILLNVAAPPHLRFTYSQLSAILLACGGRRRTAGVLKNRACRLLSLQRIQVRLAS